MKFSYLLLKKLLPRTPVASKVMDALNLHSFEVEGVTGDVIEAKLPANRYSDAVSHIGIAREVSAIFGLPFTSPVKTLVNVPTRKGYLDVKVEEPKLCSRYAARCFEVPKKLPATPASIKKVLQSCGIHVINPIVDVMNYVMLETGQPLHAFDFEKVAGMNVKGKNENGKSIVQKTITIRKARKGEHIETLDGQRVAFDEDTLLIADSQEPLAIAGIKGGKSSGVHAGTSSIIIEAANFDAPNILNCSRRLKLSTDAAIRFSHDLSPALVSWGMDRATELLTQMGCELKDSAEFYPKKATEKIIPFDAVAYEQLIGAPVKLEKAKKYFTALGFEVTSGKSFPNSKKKNGVISNLEPITSNLLVRVPAWRTDVSIPEDLIEEVVRLEGINLLKKFAPMVSVASPEVEDMVILKDVIRDIAVRMNVSEVYMSSFVSKQELEVAENFEGYGVSSHGVELENPLSDEFAYLRPSLVPGLIRAVQGNARFFNDVCIFEIGAVFHKDQGKARPTHKFMCGIHESVHCGVALARALGKDRGAETQVSRELKGIVDEMLRGVGAPEFFMKSDGHALRIEIDHHVIGRIRVVQGEKGWVIVVAELDLSELLPLVEGEKEYIPLSRFPSVMRDISVLVRDDTRIGLLLEAMQDAGGTYLEDVDLIDEYNDPKLGGKMSLTFRLVFQSRDRTLRDEEVNVEMAKIETALKEGFMAEIR